MTTTLLANGKVLFAGGDDFSGAGAMDAVEIYDPATNAVTATAPLPTGRTAHVAVLMADGRVLVTGGADSSFNAVRTADIYDPATGTWSRTGSMATARITAGGFLLPNGKVLVAGGENGSNALSSAELYDPATGTWTPTGSLNQVRNFVKGVVLNSGKVLVAGGLDGNGFGGSPIRTCEIYDPSTGTWTATADLPYELINHTVTLLENGKVLVAGGVDLAFSRPLNPSLFDPATGTWSSTGALHSGGRSDHTGTLMTDGRVILVGGLDNGGFTNTIEIFDPTSGTWSSGGNLAGPRAYHGGTLLMDGSVLVAGGFDGTPLDSIEISPAGSAVLSAGGYAAGAGGRIAPGGTVTVTVTISNSLPTSQVATYKATLPNGVTPVSGSCTGGSGLCNVTAVGQGGSELYLTADLNQTAAALSGGTVTWTGSIPGNGSVTIQFQVVVSPFASSGQTCLTTTVAGAAGTPVCLTVTAILPGPGTRTTAAGLPNQQKPGSVLVYNLYTSGISPTTNDTRITLTNTNPTTRVNVHLFFVDGSNCGVADQFITLTQNQTVSLLSSDVDPGVTGYIIAVATDENGCPIVQNDLLGGAFVKFDTGHRANLPAVSVAAVGIPACNPNLPTATLAFDGVSYNELPRALALDSLESRATGNSTMLVLNRIGGDLSTGASSLGTMAGLLFDDREASQSFTLTGGTCQVRGVLGNNYPRTAPRYDAVIPAGRTGWMKLWSVSDAAMTGALINSSTIGFSGG
ncbi:MAG: Kelch repeat-containing protein, partial [Acidobacteriota bacterium]